MFASGASTPAAASISTAAATAQAAQDTVPSSFAAAGASSSTNAAVSTADLIASSPMSLPRFPGVQACENPKATSLSDRPPAIADELCTDKIRRNAAASGGPELMQQGQDHQKGATMSSSQRDSSQIPFQHDSADVYDSTGLDPYLVSSSGTMNEQSREGPAEVSSVESFSEYGKEVSGSCVESSTSLADPGVEKQGTAAAAVTETGSEAVPAAAAAAAARRRAAAVAAEMPDAIDLKAQT